ncbi:MAG: putative S-adenosylmethionine-dependent methyltransferase [Promethearchaeota archaeon]|nr:MAG: putative S-adenosylmethionine-dependent methyltransferase [Candidatus Lokiarchaeota archaeon]
MTKKNQHYSSRFPDVSFKQYTISESLRRHLYIFKTTTGIFSFRKIDLGTQVFIEHMKIPRKGATLLDLGCGYGPIGIVLAYNSSESKVYMTDVNQRAIWSAKENVKINLPRSQDRVEVLIGNYFEPFKNKEIMFDGIYTNPPLRQGRDEFLQLFEQAPKYLNEGATFQFVIKKKMGAPYVEQYLKTTYPNNDLEVMVKRSGYWVFRFAF